MPSIQSVEKRRCLTCNRWGGWRRPGPEPGTVAFDEQNDQGPCIEGPWHGSLRNSRSACGRWVCWEAIAEAADDRWPSG